MKCLITGVARHRPDQIIIVKDRLKTRLGKIMRCIFRKIAPGDYAYFGDTSSLLNMDAVEQII
ncbi:MAG: hypothetical protein ABI045_02640 [Flavobacteriales bacterium]